jgi:hypothetical protein
VVSQHPAKDKERYTTHCLCKTLHTIFIDIQGEDLKRKKRPESLPGIEDPCSKLQGIFDRKERCHFVIRSLTPLQAAGNALAYAVQTTSCQRSEEVW